MKILMATDGSVHASSAMLAASRLLRLQDSDIDIVSIVPQPAALSAKNGKPALQRAYEDSLRARARRTAEDAERILAHLHVKARGIWEIGSPAERILALAQNHDLTVVGAYGNHDRNQPGLGPVSSQVLQSSTGNVLIGRELTNENNFRVLVALDGSEAALNALQMLGTLFDVSQLDITLMHVMEMAWAMPLQNQTRDDGIPVAEMGDYHIQLQRELRQGGDMALNNARRLLERWSVPSTFIIREGEPALELCSEAENGYDLIIAGVTGASDVKHALMGSVSLKLAWDAPCSVAVIRKTL